MIPCRCLTTCHDQGCWNRVDGYYINGTKVSQFARPIVSPRAIAWVNVRVWYWRPPFETDEGAK